MVTMKYISKVFQKWKNENIIEEVKTSSENEGHYLPHRAVIKESRSTPVRPVFDASAKEKGSPSLNCCLERGANLIELIPSILLRFRFNEDRSQRRHKKSHFYKLASKKMIEIFWNFYGLTRQVS